MFRFTCIIIVSIIFAQTSPVLAEDQLSEILAGIQKRYGDLPGLSVPYERDIISRSMAMLGEQMKTDLATGRIHFRPPSFLRIQQETPKTEAVITDGDTLWWYIPQKKQVYRYPSDRAGRELRLLSEIFQGLRQVSESFEVVQSGLGTKGDYQLKLIPNPPWPQIDHINLSVVRGDYHIRVVEIHNYIGSITRFTLGDLSVQERFEKGFFKFIIPDGVTVIEEEES
jgi:outer membrane lipoprotein-sorting protein